MENFTIKKVRAGKYTITFNNDKYIAQQRENGDWDLFIIEPCRAFGEHQEWCNTFSTLKVLKKSFI